MNVDQLLAEPEVVLGLAAVIIVVYHYVAAMPYSEFVFATQLKHRLALLLQPFAAQRGLRIVKTKQYREDDEYIATVKLTPRQLARKFKALDIDQHLINGSKRRETPNGKQWSHTQWAYQHDDGKQTEFWLYTNPDGTVDVYGHKEESVFDPDGHLSTPFVPGDPDGLLKEVIAMHKV